jgi:NADH-quinone oxidoreductase subunit M
VTSLGKVFFDLVPYGLAFAVGALIPSRSGRLERFTLGLIGVLLLCFVRGLWPGSLQSAPQPQEWAHLLNAIVFLPLVAAVALLLLPRQSPGFLKAFTLGTLLVDFAISLILLRTKMEVGWHYQYIAPWLPRFGIRYHVAVDGISYWMVLLTTFTTPIAAIVAFGSIKERIKDFCFALLLLHSGMLGAFVALDLFLFYVFWELMLVPMIILIGVWGGAERIKAAYKFFLFTMAGSVLMLAAIIYLVITHKQVAGYYTFDYLALRHLNLGHTAAWLCFGAFALAFAVKVPMFPLHTWLPDAHVQAPTSGSIILAAVLLKLGSYGYLRYCMGMFGGPAWAIGANLAGLVVVAGILYGALIAWRQDDIKKLVAYSSVAHMGFVMLGFAAATQASVQGALLQMVNHGISTGALFLLVGVIYDRRHTRSVQEFGGLASVMPIYAAVFIIVTLSSIGVPGTNGFVGEFMVLLGTFASQSLGRYATIQATLASAGVILAALYMLTMVQRMFFGPLSNSANRSLPDLTVRETIALAPALVLIFVIGLFPSTFLNQSSQSVTAVIEQFRDARRAYQEIPDDSNRAILLPRRGGPLERGYPEAPTTTLDQPAVASAATTKQNIAGVQ